MALTVGNTIVGTTTIAALVDSVFANKSAGLTGAAATFTATDSNTLNATWPGVAPGTCVIDIRVFARPNLPATITL